jgi:hypothetical protein
MKDEQKHAFATGSVFQGLRADLDGYAPDFRHTRILTWSQIGLGEDIYCESLFSSLRIVNEPAFRATLPLRLLALVAICLLASFPQWNENRLIWCKLS